MKLNLSQAMGHHTGGGGASGPSPRRLFVAIGDSLVPSRDYLEADRNLTTNPYPTNAAQFVNYAGTVPLPYQQISTNAGPIYFPESSTEVGRVSPIERMMIDYQALAGGTVGVIPLAVGGSGLQTTWNVAGGGANVSARKAEHNLAMAAYETFDGVAPIVDAVVINLGSNDNNTTANIRTWLLDLIADIRSGYTGVTSTTPFLIGTRVGGPDTVGQLNYDYRQLFAQICSEYDHLYFVQPFYPTADVNNLHPTPTESTAWGAALGLKAYQARMGTEPFPTLSIATTQPVVAGQKLALILQHSGLSGQSPYGVPVITGGADAAQFELSVTDFKVPLLRWVGDSTGPGVGNFDVEISFENNSGTAGNPTTVTIASQAEVSPVNFFTAGERGYVIDLNDLSTLWQDRAGTIPVTADGQPVGRILDKSPNGWVLQADADNSTRPTYRVDGSGNGELEFSGSQYLRCAQPVMLSGILGNQAQWTCAAGVRLATLVGQKDVFSDCGASTANFVDYLMIDTNDDFTTWGRFASSQFPITVKVNDVLTGTSTPLIFASQYDGTYTFGTVFRPLRARVASTTSTWTEANNGPSTAASASDKFVLGGRYFGSLSNGITGRIGSFFVISKVLTEMNRRDAELWVDNRSEASRAA